MLKTIRNIVIWSACVLCCIFLLNFRSMADALSSGFRMGPGDHLDEAGNIVSLNGEILVTADGVILKKTFEPGILGAGAQTEAAPDAAKQAQEQANAAAAKVSTPNFTFTTLDGKDTYTFEGKKYISDSSWGIHKLSGYNPSEKYGRMTYSGKDAVARHTVSASTALPIGTVIYLKPDSGPYPGEFEGVYVVEDRGDYHIEVEGWIDIFFDTEAEANHTTDAGWNYAEVIVLKPAE